MKFTLLVVCSGCGCNFEAPGYGATKFQPTQCLQCNVQINIYDHLSISVVADRLVLRAQREKDDGDFTISIICSAVAVECALTQVFLRWKSQDHLYSFGKQPTEAEQAAFENEYRKGTSRGFKYAADFVSDFLIGTKYDQFVTDFIDGRKIEWVKDGSTQDSSQAKLSYIQKNLFDKRNRIVHWGNVSYHQNDASTGLIAAVAAISVLKMIDSRKNLARERDWRASMNIRP